MTMVIQVWDHPPKFQKKLDKKNNGFLNLTDIKQVMLETKGCEHFINPGEDSESEEGTDCISELLKKCDVDGDGRIDYN